MTIANPLELLLDHVGHTLTVIEKTPGRSLGLRCRSTTCPGYNRVIDLSKLLGTRPAAVAPTSTSTPRNTQPPTRAEECPQHTGEYRDNCRCCASEAKGLKDGQTAQTTVRAGVDPTPEYLAARAALAAKTRTRQDPS